MSCTQSQRLLHQIIHAAPHLPTKLPIHTPHPHLHHQQVDVGAVLAAAAAKCRLQPGGRHPPRRSLGLAAAASELQAAHAAGTAATGCIALSDMSVGWQQQPGGSGGRRLAVRALPPQRRRQLGVALLPQLLLAAEVDTIAVCLSQGRLLEAVHVDTERLGVPAQRQ